MSLDMERFDQIVEAQGPWNAGYLAGLDFLKGHPKRTHTFTDPEQIKNWEAGFQKAMEESRHHIIGPEPDQAGRLDE